MGEVMIIQSTLRVLSVLILGLMGLGVVCLVIIAALLILYRMMN